jgi:hypothetical protein
LPPELERVFLFCRTHHLHNSAVTTLLQTLVRGSAELSLGTMYIDVSFPRPLSSRRLGILVHWLPIDSVLLTEPSQVPVGYRRWCWKATSPMFTMGCPY